jgi:hypothetical protein
MGNAGIETIPVTHHSDHVVFRIAKSELNGECDLEINMSKGDSILRGKSRIAIWGKAVPLVWWWWRGFPVLILLDMPLSPILGWG